MTVVAAEKTMAMMRAEENLVVAAVDKVGSSRKKHRSLSIFVRPWFPECGDGGGMVAILRHSTSNNNQNNWPQTAINHNLGRVIVVSNTTVGGS